VEKYLYPSAGSLYAVQTYLHLKPGAVEGLAAGAYYYHPVDHALLCLTPDAEIDARIHEPHVNRPIFEQAGFSIFLVARVNAIAPLYGDYSPRFASLEAGHMGQVLMSFAPENKIALCPIGDVEFEPLRAMFDLDEDHVLMHLFVGGPMLAAEDTGAISGVKENHGREEWEL
jgi:SagB-type dehydrogenase family enzyme